MKKGSTRPGHPFFAICQELADAAALVEAGYRTMLVRRQAELHRWLQQELARRKRALNLRSYDDLLLDLQLALARDGGGDLLADTLRGRYQAALIDEFQDTDPLQWRIFARIAGCAPSPPAGEGRGGGEAGSGKGNDATAPYPLFLIGDPKQAIYSFRGADIHAYIAAARSAGPERRQTLQTNRRSAPSLVGAVNTLFSAEDPFHSSDITFTPVLSGRDPDQGVLERGEPVASPFRFWFCRREEPGKAAGKGAARGALITAVATEIARLLAGDHTIIGRDGTVRPLAPEDIAVLVKSHYQADLVQNALTALAIPSVQHGSATIFETTEAMDWLRILRAAAEPGNARLVREALASPCIGLSSDQIFAMQTDEAAWETWALRFQRFRNAADSGAIMTLAALLLGECGGRQRLLALPSGERRLTNFLHCCELLHQAEREHGGGLEGAATWLERRIAAPHGGDETLLRLETDDHAVIISTIHASKGLEYPVVFLPFAWDPPMADARVLFHDDDGSLILDLGTEQRDTVHMAQAAAERDAEAARLFYVAVTRAEFLCYVAWGCINDAFGSPLRRLLHGERFRDAKSFAAASDSDIMADITALADRAGREYGGAPITVSCLPSPEPAPSPRRPAPDTAGLPCHCRVLTHPVPDDWRITSFSGMVAGGERHQQPRDYDAVIPADRPDQAAEPPVGDGGGSIFDFPRGAAAGTCLHELFERLDFARMTEKGVEDICRERLACNGFDPCWLPALQRLVRDVTSAPVLTDIPGFSLSCLKRGSWQAEMEFFLPLAGIDTARMTGLFDGLVAPSRHGPFSEVLETLRIRETRGMLHGFIDLVFEHAGRYYLADWKSNHLGGHREDYLPGELIAPMAGHAYILQYHLYTLALDRLLQLRLPGYRYETHFGGILYLFVRGISADNGECGIYRDRPDPEFIRRAAAILA
jgi:exodeoxyribonuclease V beta subunit